MPQRTSTGLQEFIRSNLRGDVDRDGNVVSGPVPPEESQDRGDTIRRDYLVDFAMSMDPASHVVLSNVTDAPGPEDEQAEEFRQQYPENAEDAFAVDPAPSSGARAEWVTEDEIHHMPNEAAEQLARVRPRRAHRLGDVTERRPYAWEVLNAVAGAVTEPIKRVFFKADLTDPEDRIVQKRRRTSEERANLVSSLVDDGDEHTRFHAPVLDIDLPCKLIESTTPGHFHLYIDKKMTWERYALLLNALWRAGIIEEGFYKMSMKREATFVRKPGVVKEEGDISSSEDVPEGPIQEEVQF